MGGNAASILLSIGQKVNKPQGADADTKKKPVNSVKRKLSIEEGVGT